MTRSWMFFLATCALGITFLQSFAADPATTSRLVTDGSAAFITVKYGKVTNDFVTVDGHQQLFPKFVESHKVRYRLDYRRQPDLKGFSAIITWGDAREKRLHVTGTLEFRHEKPDDEKSTMEPVIVVKTLASGPMPFELMGKEPVTADNPFDKPAP